MMQQDKEVHLLKGTHYNVSFILIYDIFNSIRKLACVALLLKYCQGQAVYCIPIHTVLQGSVEKTGMDTNGKCVCL